MLRTALAASALVALIGCAGTQTVPVKADNDSDIVRLAGEWKGNYKGIDSGRTGTIKFNLDVGRHTAQGEVLMFDKGQDAPAALAIKFVKVDDGRVSGKIGPYLDPQCSCEVETEFLGDVEGDVIDGTFVTRIAALNLEQSGLWTVSRDE